MKPGDFFLGVIDFFATLVPGAIGAFIILRVYPITPPEHWLQIAYGPAEGWIVFLIAAYLIGQFILAAGSFVLDPLYDRVYSHWRRVSRGAVKKELGTDATHLDILLKRVTHLLRESGPKDKLLETVQFLKSEHIGALRRPQGVTSEDLSNNFWWASAVLRLQAPMAGAEIDKLIAQSKLFRGLTVIAVLFIPVLLTKGVAGWPIWSTIALVVLCLWRFCRLRWGSIVRTYEYFVALEARPR